MEDIIIKHISDGEIPLSGIEKAVVYATNEFSNQVSFFSPATVQALIEKIREQDAELRSIKMFMETFKDKLSELPNRDHID